VLSSLHSGLRLHFEGAPTDRLRGLRDSKEDHREPDLKGQKTGYWVVAWVLIAGQFTDFSISVCLLYYLPRYMHKARYIYAESYIKSPST
jgi:hypothetical protein